MTLELCRICGNSQDLIKILDKGPEMLDKLLKCANIVIKSNDILPKLICQHCDKTLEMSYLLRKQSEEMQQRLQQEVRKRDIRPMSKDDVQYISDEDSIMDNNDHNPAVGINNGEMHSVLQVPVDVEILDTHSESTIVASETECVEEDEPDYDYHIPSTTIVDAADSNDSYGVHGSIRRTSKKWVNGKASKQSLTATCNRTNEDANDESEIVDVCGDNGMPDDFMPSDSSSNLLEPCHSNNAGASSQNFNKHNDDSHHYQCQQCFAGFPTRYRLMRHQEIHNELKSKKCPQCDREYRTSYNLRRHIRTCHAENTKFQCTTCNLSFNRQDVLKRHMNTVHASKKLYCKSCGQSFRSKYDLTEHKAMNHCTVLPEMSDVPNQRHDQPEPVLLCSDNKYKCEICNMKFKTLSIFRCHLLIHNNIRPFPCSTCPKSFRTRYALINHERIHSNEKPFVCDICLKSFRQVTHMKHHRMRHTNDMPVKCPECQMGFITKFRLREHLRKDHYTMKAFKCAECPEEFFLKYDLKRHARLIHLRSVSVADSDNENVKNVPEGSSESETYLPVENNDGDNGDGEHYNDIAALYDTDRVGNANIEEHQNNNENSNKESNTDIINIAEDTDIEPEEEEEEDDDVRIIEPDESNAIINNIHTREQSDQIVEEDTSCSNIFFLNDVDSPLTPPETQSNENLREEEQEVSCGPQIGHFGLGPASPSVTQPPTIPLSNEKDEEDNTYATSNEPVIDNIQLDSSSSCDSPPPPQTCATTSNYFNIEQEEEIHITEEEIETYTTSTSTYYNVQDITQS